MGVKKVIKKGLSFGFQPTRWIGVEHVKSNGKVCADLVRDFLGKKTNAKQQSEQKKEAEAQERQLTSADLKNRKRLAFLLIIVYTLGGLGCFAYTGYLWFSKAFILQGFMSLIVGLLLLVYILRELLVFYQIKCKRHRMNIQELLHALFHGEKK